MATNDMVAFGQESNVVNSFFDRRYKPNAPIVQTRHFKIGEFHAHTGHLNFASVAAPFDEVHCVFPSCSIMIETDAGRSLLADRSWALVYPSGLDYRRYGLNDGGDHCMWVSPTEALYRSQTLLGEYCRMLQRRAMEPFRAAVPNAMFLELRAIQYALINERQVIGLDRRMWRICSILFGVDESKGMGDWSLRGGISVDARSDAGGCALADRVESYVTLRYAEPEGLSDVARAVGVSTEHMCRVFRGAFGVTIHQRILQLRMRRAVERLLEGERGLTELALDLGFNSHAHFSATMRRSFGYTPSQIRAMLR